MYHGVNAYIGYVSLCGRLLCFCIFVYGAFLRWRSNRVCKACSACGPVAVGGPDEPCVGKSGGQWRRNEFESGGTRPALSAENFFCCTLHFLAKQVQLVVLVSAFVMVSPVSSVSFLLFFYSQWSPCPAIFKSGGTCPRALVSRRRRWGPFEILARGPAPTTLRVCVCVQSDEWKLRTKLTRQASSFQFIASGVRASSICRGRRR